MHERVAACPLKIDRPTTSHCNRVVLVHRAPFVLTEGSGGCKYNTDESIKNELIYNQADFDGPWRCGNQPFAFNPLVAQTRHFTLEVLPVDALRLSAGPLPLDILFLRTHDPAFVPSPSRVCTNQCAELSNMRLHTRACRHSVARAPRQSKVGVWTKYMTC